MAEPERNTVTGVVLAGGRATRMGGMDKGLVEVAGRAMVDHVLQRLRPQTAHLVVNANRNEADYRQRGWPVVPDAFGEFAGPLAGIAAGLAASTTDWVVTVPCDSPMVPPDLVSRLAAGVRDQDADIGVAHAEGRMQPVFALLPGYLLGDLQAFLREGGRKIDLWYSRHRLAVVAFDDRPEAFVNVNTPEDRSTVAARLADADADGDRERRHD